MPGLYNQEVAEFPGLESWFLTAMVYGPTGTSLPLFGRYIVNGDRKLKLRIFLTSVGDFAFKLLMDPFQEFVCWHFTEGKGIITYTPFTQGGRGTHDGGRGHPPLCVCSQPRGNYFVNSWSLVGSCDLILFHSLFWSCFWVASSGWD